MKKNSKKIEYLCVDTDIFIQCCFLEIEGDDLNVLTKLHELLDENKVKLLLPEIIELEFNKRFKTKKDSIFNEINRHKKHIEETGDLNKKPREDLKNIIESYIKEKENLSEKVKKEIESIFKHSNTIRNSLKITPQIFIEAYKMSFSQKKPYKTKAKIEKIKNDKEGDILEVFEIQKDCLIIESLIKFFKDKPKHKFYFCSKNKSDFAEENKKTGLSIHNNIKEKFSDISYFENLGTLLRDKFKIPFSKNAIEKLDKPSYVINNTDSDLGTGEKVIDLTLGEPK